MRHQKHGRKFGRKSAPRRALFSNLVSALIQHERIETTDAKAKELRRIAERTISWATSVGNLVASDKQDAEDEARIIHAKRMAGRVLKHKPTLEKLFDDVGPRMAGRPGGFTRIMKLRNRHGDAAPISIIELVDRAEAAPADTEAPAPKGGKSAKSAKAAAPTASKDDGDVATKPAKKKAKKADKAE